MVRIRDAGTLTDMELVEQCRQGNAEAFNVIVNRYKGRLYNVALRFIGNREDALDVSQDAFIKAFRSIDTFRGQARLYTWLYSIAANLARNRLRDGSRKGRNKSISLEALQESAPAAASIAAASTRNPGTDAMDHEMEEALQQCLDELPDHYRLPFVLRTFDDLTYEEIAEVMDCPPGTVKSRLNQARKQLRDRLRERAILEID